MHKSPDYDENSQTGEHVMCLGAGPTSEVFHKEDLSTTEDSLLSTTDLHLHISIQIHYELSERERKENF